MPFPTTVNKFLAPAQPGDFASSNPRSSLIAPSGGFVAGPNGLIIGLFCWQNDAINSDAGGPYTLSNAGTGAPSGFIHREGQGLATVYLQEWTVMIPAGFTVSAMSSGDFWAVTSTATTIGQKIFANNTTGAASSGAAGATITGDTETKWYAASVQNAGELVKISTTSIG